MAITFKELPGPKGLPIVGSAFNIDVSNMHNQIEKLADEYGPVYRLILGPTKLTVVTHPEIIQHILRERPFLYIRMAKLDRILRAEGVHGVFNAEREEWNLHRRMVAKGLDVKHQKAFFDRMLITVDRLYRKWEKAAAEGGIVDIQNDFLRFTVDITTETAFGYEMNTLEEQGGVVQDHMEKIFPMIFKRINDPIAWHKLIRSKKDRAYDKAMLEINKFIDQLIEEGRKRLADNPELRENPNNFLEAILVEAEHEEAFGDEEVKGNLMTLLLAGEDTTAHSLAWTIYMLTKYPEHQDGLRAEADEILGDARWIRDYDDIQKFRFTEGVASETMRLKPVAPLLLFEPTEDVEVHGYLFKKGCQILVESRHAAVQEENFSDSKSFKPSRWLKESRCPVHNMDAYIPFGGGPRYCPGRNLAMLEIKLVLSMLFKNFNVEMLTNHDDVKEIMAFAMNPSPFKVKLTPRINKS